MDGDDKPKFHTSYLQLYKQSLGNACNITSNIILDKASQDYNKDSMDKILSSAHALLPSSALNKASNWKSSLRKFSDPIKLFEKSSCACQKCSTSKNFVGFKTFLHNQCTCDTGLTASSEKNKNVLKKTKSIMRILHTDNSSQESTSEDDQVQLYKPKIGSRLIQKKLQTTNIIKNDIDNVRNNYNGNLKCNLVANTDHDMEIQHNTCLEDEENRAHKSNVAKITFKTARETLLASNPAAKRSLGASRKAQSKFISPMIGVQEKQEKVEPTITDERLKHIDVKMIELIESEIIDKGTPIGWDEIAGLQMAKSVIQEAVVWPLLRPDIFTGLRRPPKGILLFGPPGTGKTLIGKCVAAQCKATFFSISASSLTSKWIGDGEKMVRALFAVARCHQPAVIFIDEIDSLLTQRSDSEHEATRRIKTEFLVQFDGAATGEEDRLLIVGATNRPHELDEAARRRLVKRLYIPLPDNDARSQIIRNLLQNENNDLTEKHITEIAKLTEGYSGADMKSLCSEAAMGPIRSVPLSQIVSIDPNKVRPVCVQDFINALQRVRPSVSQDDLGQYVKWNNTYGQGF